MHSWSFGHLRLKMYASNTVSFSYYQMFIKEIYLSDKARSTIRHTFTRGKKNSRTKEGAGPPPPGPPLNPPLFLVGAEATWYRVKIPKDVYRCCKNYLKIVLPWL